jgi:hypothetical protein
MLVICETHYDRLTSEMYDVVGLEEVQMHPIKLYSNFHLKIAASH